MDDQKKQNADLAGVTYRETLNKSSKVPIVEVNPPSRKKVHFSKMCRFSAHIQLFLRRVVGRGSVSVVKAPEPSDQECQNRYIYRLIRKGYIVKVD